MTSSVFAGVLRHHFLTTDDYISDLFLDLLNSEKELIESLNEIRISDDARTPSKHRKKLVEWMIHLCDELKVGYKTKNMAVIMVDLCLTKIKIHTNFLQLLGITCIFISIKCEESFIYSLTNACEHCAKCYTKEQVGAMEMLVYKTLKWKLHYPTPGEIARRLVHITNAVSFEGMPQFFKKIDSFIDLCLFENELIEYHPSCIAAASIMCSFGGSEAHVEGWIAFIKEHNILNTDFDKIIILYQNVTEQILKHNPSYFQSPAMMPKEQPSFNLSNAMGQPKINQGQPVEFMQEYSLISADSQETCMMANGNDVTLESFSAVGTPVQVSKKMPEDFRASLLDTEKLMKESPKRMQEEREERRVYNNSSGMEIEKM